MSSPSADIHIPCCSPATTESVAVVRDKVADSRADILVGQGQILKSQGDYTSAILRDANANALGITSTVDRNAFAAMSQIDKFGLANLNATTSEATRVGDAVDRSSYGLSRDVHGESDKITGQASTIAWNQTGIQGAGFAEARAQLERVNDAQSAYSDRAFKYLQSQNQDSFGRLSAQTEAGFLRTGAAVGSVDKQVVQSEMGVDRALTAGFTDAGNALRDSYARLSEQNCQTKEVIAAYGNRASDQTATVLATLSGQHASLTRDLCSLGKESAVQFGAIQLEASKNTAAIQMQAAMNAKESLVEQSKWFALAEKTAMVNKCEIESKLADCCCEIKQAVHGTASATQALIQAQETTRVRDALAVAATENAILKLRREEHHHYQPFYPHHGGGSRRGSRGS